MTFLDDDPEDGFDATDLPVVRLFNIQRRVSFVLDKLDSPDLERRLRSVLEDIDRIRLELNDG